MGGRSGVRVTIALVWGRLGSCQRSSTIPSISDGSFYQSSSVIQRLWPAWARIRISRVFVPKRGKLPPEQARLATAIGIILFLTIDIACTVHLWGCVWILSGVRIVGLRARLTELAYLARVAGPQGVILERSVLRA